ncbi:TetR/AcrR family transcriptional regulator [Bosea sp. (in: a-proteobacteria)]|jgi:AcrR family transcriptional regulator|uniref:TetR/AcrR family transcriptional regulator n=1 Tax=Bosea sp. (in: a-proteobacteria) TaxID=1871050 RepID=UPI002601F87E|nr:TetR/AcrR family transcriptional regulator [Bosea sp. (in: a-proteobacteria)]MCO5089900.1 TetR/AcrR family transcriptional regulator [Bosea sp. (in: a-proteobacteria)]
MGNAYTRIKQPELVRRALLDHAAKLAVEQGLAAVTVQAVSDAAGVTKGGFTHHFPSKQALIDTVFHELLERLGHDLDRRMEADAEHYGAFTRAYLEAVFDMDPSAKGSPWAALSISMLTDPKLRVSWTQWFQERLERHEATDSDVQLTAIRLAADGLWLADLTGVALGERIELRNHLLQHTYEQGVERPHEAANSRTGRSKKNGKNVRMATS